MEENNSRKNGYEITGTGKFVVTNKIKRLRELIKNGESITGGMEK